MMDIDPHDRAFLDAHLSRFGSAWAGGLARQEASFSIDVRKLGDEYTLSFTTRGPEHVTFCFAVTRDGGYKGFEPSLPEGPELDAAALARIDEALRATKELWLIERANAELRVLDTTSGLAVLRSGRMLDTRRLGDFGVLYLKEGTYSFGRLFCVATDLTRGEVVSAFWAEVPANDSRLLSPSTVDFLDRAFKTHGNFGPYGQVTEGIRALARVENFRLQVREEGGVFRISLTPKDHVGHFLEFDVDASTGHIDGCTAGHFMPPPSFADDG